MTIEDNKCGESKTLAILAELQQRGVSVAVEGNSLILEPKSAQDYALIARLREAESQKLPKTIRRAASGRPPKYESRVAEFCQALLVWNRSPEAERPSLRILARALGTSHQTLSYHLNRLDGWQAEEKIKRIRARAEAEGRELTFRERLEAMLISTRAKWIQELRQAASRGPLNPDQFKWLEKLVRQGLPGAKEIREKCRQMTPAEEKQARAAAFTSAAASTIKRIKEEAERGPLCWQDVERLKCFARRRCAEAKELLEKYSKSALPRPQVPQ